MQEFNFDMDDLFKDDEVEEQEIKEVKEQESVKVADVVKEKPTQEISPLEPKRPTHEEILKKETQVVKEDTPQPVATKGKTNPSDFNVVLAERTVNKISELAKISNQVITEREKSLATDIVLSANKSIIANGYNWKQIDVVNNNLFGDIKRWAKLGVDASTDHLYPELRKNNKTNSIDIRIKPQYQTIRKLIVKYCTKKIINFRDDVVCKSDNLSKKFDFLTGSEKILDHTYGETRNPNLLDDIVGAYVVAFYENNDGSIGQIVSYIDKNRIMRGYNSAQTKNVWDKDTKKMVIKTAYWEMWNGASIQPFMAFPDDIINDLSVVNETSDVDFSNKDHKFNNLDSAEDNFKERANTGEIIDF